MKRRFGLLPSLFAMLMAAVWVLWWFLVPAFDIRSPVTPDAPATEAELPALRIAGGVQPPAPKIRPASPLSYMPLDEKAGQYLPVIWSPTWLSAGAGPLLGLDGQEELSITLPLESPLPYAARHKAVRRPLGSASANVRAMAERYMRANALMPRVIESPSKAGGLSLQVDPPVPDLDLHLKALEDTARRASSPWIARLVLNVSKEGEVGQALLEGRTGDPDVDAALVHWAYRLPFGPGWDREFIRLTVRWDNP